LAIPPQTGGLRKCQALEGLWFEEKPNPAHPNCRCDIEEFQAVRVTGKADAIIVPPGVDIEANLAEASKIKNMSKSYRSVLPLLGTSASFLLKRTWVYLNFASKKRYDYKQLGPEYEDFGNYHYGLYTKTMGLNATFAQVAAGVAQWLAGTSRGSEYWASWFDDPHDNELIKRGQNKLR
jgi:hypothetical protein